MFKKVSFHLRKGGVGKTTISVTPACRSALENKKTLGFDCERQGNLFSLLFKETPPFELFKVSHFQKSARDKYFDGAFKKGVQRSEEDKEIRNLYNSLWKEGEKLWH